MRIFRFLLLLLVSVGLFCPTAPAGILPPQTDIQHNPPANFAAGTRLIIEAQISDPLEIREARCYFRTDFDLNYLYVSMREMSGSRYQCTLPGFMAGSQTLEYFFLVVNGRGQAVRTTPYSAAESDIGAVPPELIPADPAVVLAVRSELGVIDAGDTGISDGHIALAPTTGAGQMYGLRAGVYAAEDIPDTLAVMPGYFGGFVFDRMNDTVRPVPGLAPNLDSSSPVDGSTAIPFGNSVDVPEESDALPAPNLLADATEPPPIGGTDWSGYFTRTDSDVREYLTASVVLTGTQVTITTTLVGLGHFLAGNINANGDMLLYDIFDGEDWTTHYGPATSTEINIYDYIWAPVLGAPEPPLNAIILYRSPLPPASVQASDGLYPDEIAVDWLPSEGATLYKVYTCSTDLTDSCIFLSEVSTNGYVDSRGYAGRIFFRVQACNVHGCGLLSDYDIGYNQHLSLPHILEFLLRSRG